MNLTLPHQIQQLIEDKVRSGKYSSAEDVVSAAVAHLDQDEQSVDFEPGELERLIKAGEESGAPLDGEQVLAEIRELQQRSQTKAG